MNYDIEITNIYLSHELLIISWTSNLGFGETTINFDNKNQKSYIDDEFMSDDFTSQVLDKLGKYILLHS